MTKDEFITARTKIISDMLDNPDECGIYPTSKCFKELDELYVTIVLDLTAPPNLDQLTMSELDTLIDILQKLPETHTSLYLSRLNSAIFIKRYPDF